MGIMDCGEVDRSRWSNIELNLDQLQQDINDGSFTRFHSLRAIKIMRSFSKEAMQIVDQELDRFWAQLKKEPETSSLPLRKYIAKIERKFPESKSYVYILFPKLIAKCNAYRAYTKPNDMNFEERQNACR